MKWFAYLLPPFVFVYFTGSVKGHVSLFRGMDFTLSRGLTGILITGIDLKYKHSQGLQYKSKWATFNFFFFFFV